MKDPQFVVNLIQGTIIGVASLVCLFMGALAYLAYKDHKEFKNRTRGFLNP